MTPLLWWLCVTVLMAAYIACVAPYFIENIKNWREARAAALPPKLVLPEGDYQAKRLAKRINAGAVIAVTALLFTALVSYTTYQLATLGRVKVSDSSLNLEYRVTGSEKRTRELGTKDEYKLLELSVELVNRSKSRMMLEFTLVSPLINSVGSQFPVHYQVWWKEPGEPLSQDGRLGSAFVAIDGESALNGKLCVRIPASYLTENKDFQPLKWGDFPSTDTKLEVRDRISGKSIVASYKAHPESNERGFIAIEHPPHDEATNERIANTLGSESAEDGASLDLSYRATAMRVAPEPLQSPTMFASHVCRIECDLVNRSRRNMSLKFELLVKTKFEGKEILYPCYGTWDLKSGSNLEEDISVLNIDREAAIFGALLTFMLPDPQKIKFDFNSWDEVGYTRSVLKITDAVSGAVVSTDNLMSYPWKKGDQGDLIAAFEDWHKQRKKLGITVAGMPPIIGSVEDFLRTLDRFPMHPTLDSNLESD